MAAGEQSKSELLLERIFDITHELYEEMGKAGSQGNFNHFKLFGLFAELGRALVNADRCSFWKWDRRSHQLVTNAAVGTGQIVIDEGSGLVGRALREMTPIVTNDPYNHPDFNSSVDKKTGYVTKSILVMPVSNCKGEIIGAYQAINKLDSETGFDLEADSRRLSLATFICGITLESDMFLDDSERDKLTDLKNRVGFHNDYRLKWGKILNRKGDDKRVSIIMCDIDFFKKVNDTYGHNAGDAMLKHVAGILTASIRESDGAYRWGGEEFILIIPGSNIQGAADIAERIRRNIMTSVCSFEGTDIKATMSFGCAELSPELDAEENIKIADERLYRAKEGGRNRVIWK